MTTQTAKSFLDHFEMVPATTKGLKEETYRLRYQVYCIETGFEDPRQFPDGMETDEYDTHSAHFMIRHRATNECVATTRLILQNPSHPDLPFPIEQHCRIENTKLLADIPRERIAEASRFCVSGRFKRREGEQRTLAGISTHRASAHPADGEHRQAFPNFILPLLACLVRMSIQHGITHWYAFMEPSFARLVKGFGVYLTPIGPLVEYHGKRRPYVIQLADLLAGAKNKDPAIWGVLTNNGLFWHDSDCGNAEPCVSEAEAPHRDPNVQGGSPLRSGGVT